MARPGDGLVQRARRQGPLMSRTPWRPCVLCQHRLEAGNDGGPRVPGLPGLGQDATGIIGENGTGAIEYTRTMEMSAIVTGDVDETRLVVPEGYTKAVTGRGRGGS